MFTFSSLVFLVALYLLLTRTSWGRVFTAWMRRHPLWTILLWIVVGAFPLLLTIFAGTVANAFGCQLDESGVHPCVIAGTDYGELLAFLGIMFWLTLVSLPVALGCGLVSLAACMSKN